MNHIEQKMLFDVAGKIYDGIQLTDEEQQTLFHISECEACEQKMLLCLEILRNLEPDMVEQALFKQDEQQSEYQEAQVSVLCQVRFALGQLKTKIESVVDYVAEALPVFENADSFAFARGVEEETEVTLVAGESLIEYDKETNILTVALDEEDYPQEGLIAVVTAGEKEISQPFAEDGHGMLEVKIPIPEAESFVLQIKSK